MVNARSTTVWRCVRSCSGGATSSPLAPTRSHCFCVRGVRDRRRSATERDAGFALWDELWKRLRAAGYPIGVVPRYWRSDGRRVDVASELGAIVAGNRVLRALDKAAMDRYLTWRFVRALRAVFDGLSKLAAPSNLPLGRAGRHLETL